MRILALDSALARCSATIVSGGQCVAGYQQDMERGHASVLAGMAHDALRDATIQATALDAIAVTVGPGSFTGVRGAIALGMGIGISAGVPVIGVTVGEALADSLPFLGGRALWCAITSRRGRVFLEIGEQVLSLPVTDLPWPGGPVALAGSAAIDVASRLAAGGADVMLTNAQLPVGRHIAQVAEHRFYRRIRPLPVEPLYVDQPQAKRPIGGQPPPPVS
jgi:tRNA threonylcarbamoyladenosine biosynthesis protein TsaB